MNGVLARPECSVQIRRVLVKGEKDESTTRRIQAGHFGSLEA